MAFPLLHGIAELVVRRMLGMESQESCSDVCGSPWRSWGSAGRDSGGIQEAMFSGFRSHLEAFPGQDSSNEHPLSAGLGNTRIQKIPVLGN